MSRPIYTSDKPITAFFKMRINRNFVEQQCAAIEQAARREAYINSLPQNLQGMARAGATIIPIGSGEPAGEFVPDSGKTVKH